MLERGPVRWLRFVTSEIWCARRSVLLDEASEALQIPGDQR